MILNRSKSNMILRDRTRFYMLCILFESGVLDLFWHSQLLLLLRPIAVDFLKNHQRKVGQILRRNYVCLYVIPLNFLNILSDV